MLLLPWDDPLRADLFGGDHDEMMAVAQWNRGIRDLQSQVASAARHQGQQQQQSTGQEGEGGEGGQQQQQARRPRGPRHPNPKAGAGAAAGGTAAGG